MPIDTRSTLALRGLSALRPQPPEHRRVIMEGKFSYATDPLCYYPTSLYLPHDARLLQGNGYDLGLVAHVNHSGVISDVYETRFPNLPISYPFRWHGPRLATVICEDGRIFFDRTLTTPTPNRLTRTLENLAERFAPNGLSTFDTIYDTLVYEDLSKRR